MKGATPITPLKKPAPKDLQTIDDPFFDDFEDFGVPKDGGFGARAAPFGRGSGGLPGSGPPSLVSVSSQLGAGAPAPAGAIPPGAEAGTERPKQMAIGKSIEVGRTKEVQNAARTRQRRLNVIVGLGIFAGALIALFSLAVIVFSGSHESESNATTLTSFPTDDSNTTEDKDDAEMRRFWLQKLPQTPEEYDYEDYEVRAPNEAGSVAVHGKGEAADFLQAPEYPTLKARRIGVRRSVTSFQTRPTLSLPYSTGTNVLENTIEKRPQNGPTSSILEQPSTKSAYSLQMNMTEYPGK